MGGGGGMKLNDPELEQNSWQQAKPYSDPPQILKRKSPIRVVTCRDCGQKPRHQAEAAARIQLTNHHHCLRGAGYCLVIRAPDS